MADYDDDYEEGESNTYMGSQVKNFVQQLSKAIDARDEEKIASMYEHDYTQVTENNYKSSPWPSVEAVETVRDDENFLLFYKELYYRHIYAKKLTTVENRFESFHNYTSLFNIILGLTTEDPELLIPAVWLGDIVDEFIYQFRSFHQYRTNLDELKSKGPRGGLQLLRDHPHAWSAQSVIRYLHALVKKAGIDITSMPGEREQKADEGISPMFKTLGEFSLIGLAHVLCLLSDYVGALQVMEAIDFNSSHAAFKSNVPARVTLYYYKAFSYLMLRRYADATTACCEVLSWLSRNESHLPRSYQGQLITKKTEALFGLLAMSLALNPQSIDDGLATQMNEHVTDKLQRLNAGDAMTFEEVFDASCPKFISAGPPDYDSENSTHLLALTLQRRVFLSELKQREGLPEIHGFLKMATSISIAKLAKFLKMDEETLTNQLIAIKNKNVQRVNNGNQPAYQGTLTVSGEVDFFIRDDMVHVAEHTRPKRYGDNLVTQILKLGALASDLQSQRVVRPALK